MKPRGKWRAPLIVGAAGAILVLGLVIGLILPKAGQIRSRQHDLTKAKGAQNGLVLQLAELRAVAKEAPANRAKLAKLRVEVPDVADLPDIIREINSAADKSAVDFVSIAPSTPAPDASGTVSIISTGLDVTGSYFAVDEFLYRLETLPRIARVTTIGMTPESDSSSSLTVTLTALFYTTDLSSGPGSVPGHTDATEAGVAPPVTSSPSPGPTPSSGG